MCFSCQDIKQGWGDPRECGQTPCQQQPINLQHSLPDPKPKPTLVKAAKKRGQQEVAPAPFLNTNPIVQLVGCSNKVPVVIDGHEVIALIDSDTQVLSISAQFCKDLALQIQPLGQLLELEGTGEAAIPYLGFVKVNLQIPGIRNYSKDVLLLVIPTMTYSKTVPVMVGSKIIDKALNLMTLGELAEATMTWRQAHFGAVMLGSLQLSHSGSGKSKQRVRANCSSQKE